MTKYLTNSCNRFSSLRFEAIVKSDLVRSSIRSHVSAAEKRRSEKRDGG